MICADTSAILAILFDEPECTAFDEILYTAERNFMSSGSLVEVRMVFHRKAGGAVVEDLARLLDAYRVEIVPVDQAQANIAHQAFLQFGKGNGHPAQLNFGDLFSYALARSRDLPLLFKGEDFAATDIKSAMAG